MDPFVILAVVLVIAFLVVVWAVGVYNTLVALRNRLANAFSQIDVQLKRRYDLIPNLVETAKGYLAHERQTLEAVISARNQAVAAQVKASADPTDGVAMRQLLTADNALTGGLGRLFALAEAYPDLKADSSMRTVMEELSSTENRIAFARQAYNDAVMAYNTAREQVPGNLVAGFGNFPPATSWELDEPAAKQAPQVKFT